MRGNQRFPRFFSLIMKFEDSFGVLCVGGRIENYGVVLAIAEVVMGVYVFL